MRKLGKAVTITNELQKVAKLLQIELPKMELDINKDYSVSKEYQSEEFPLGYNRFLLKHQEVLEAFVTESLQKIYYSGQLSGTRLLDFGCGPTVHRIASASLQFNDIVVSEWSEANRNQVQKWLSGDSDALDWTQSLEKCASTEGFRDLEKGVEEIERRIRKAVKKIVPCDALSDQMLPDGLEEFDCINTSYCLESACFTVEIYKKAVKKLSKYLKKGGAIVMVTALCCESYDVHKRLPGLYLTEEVIKDAICEAGLELRDLFIWKDTGKNDSLKYGGVMVNYSVKL